MKLEAHKIKYVIAREGLVIVALLAVAALSYYADTWEKDQLANYTKYAGEFELVRNGTPYGMRAYIDGVPRSNNPFAKYDTKNYYIVPGIKAQFPKSTDYAVIQHTMQRDFKASLGRLTETDGLDGGWTASDMPTGTNINARYDNKGNRIFTGFPWTIDFQKVMFFFLVVAYPAYLLVRFIAWAVATVKKPSSALS